MPKLFCLLILWTACAEAQTVEGTVLNSVTGRGIAGVRVDIVQANKVYSGSTDAQGRFRIQDIKDGAYTAHYYSPEYWREIEPPRPFQVTAGADSVKLEARMIPLGRITGRVVDGRGEAVPNAQLDLNETAGRMHLRAQTDANGKFQLHQLLFPGVYSLAIVPPKDLKPPDPEPDSDRVLRWARTYYTGVTLPEAASKIVLRPGSELLDVEIKLSSVPAHAVRGTLLNPDGTPVPKVAITLADDASPFGDSQPVRVESGPDGAFEFPTVVDGDWLLSSELTNGGVRLRALQRVIMLRREIEGVKLQLNAPFRVQGRVIEEDPKKQPSKPPQVTLSPLMRGSFLYPGALSARTDAEGNFSIDGVYPGIYRIEGSAPGSQYYLDSVKLGAAELAAPETELSSGALPIVMTYKLDGGTVRGAVEKCASGTVILAPQDQAMRVSPYVRTAQCNSSDRYEITGVRPGDYYVLSFAAEAASVLSLATQVDAGIFNQTDRQNNYKQLAFTPGTPKLDEASLQQATRITVRAGETSTVDLHTITSPQY